MEWTRQMRYRKLEDANLDDLTNLQQQVATSPWRQKFHIQPPTGLLNDPNGFSYYKGEYHLFYQWFPLGPVHGLKYWYHVTSKDLVHWEEQGVGIAPDQDYDSHGAYSGSGIVHEGKLHLLYTGNHRTDDWERIPTQALAILDEKGQIQKLPEPVIKDVPTGYTDHFRDPKVWKQDSRFYAIIGAQRINETGCTVLYESQDLQNWTFKGEIQTDYLQFGYMWECPDYLELDDKGILIFSPQGLEPKGHSYRNIYQSGYLLGDKLDLETLQYNGANFTELDHGFDFYAPQTMEAPDGRRLLVGWMGLPEIAYPTDAHNWAHCLTLPRELSLVDGKLRQKPIQELEKLRKDGQSLTGNQDSDWNLAGGTYYELMVQFENIQASNVGLKLRVGKNEETTLSYDGSRIFLDRSKSGEAFAAVYGTTREIPYTKNHLKLQVFMDTSSVEIFINDGEFVMTARIFPEPESEGIEIFALDGTCDITYQKWNLEVD